MNELELLFSTWTDEFVVKMVRTDRTYTKFTCFYQFLNHLDKVLSWVIYSKHLSSVMFELLCYLYQYMYNQDWLVKSGETVDDIYQRMYSMFHPWAMKRVLMHEELEQTTLEEKGHICNRMVMVWSKQWHEICCCFSALASRLCSKDLVKIYQYILDQWFPQGHNRWELTKLIEILF